MTEARDHLGRLWTAHTYKIGEEPRTDYSHLSPGERLEMVNRLSEFAWEFVRAGAIARGESPPLIGCRTPIRVIRRPQD